MQDTNSMMRRARKSRSTGLRTTTGCLTCRQRHKKCDERHPICGPCSIAARDCVFPSSENNNLVRGETPRRRTHSTSNSEARPEETLPDIPPQPEIPPVPTTESSISTRQAEAVESAYSHSADSQIPYVHHRLEDEQQVHSAYSPDTIASDSLTADLASTRWLDLLAYDAAQADTTFSLAPTRCCSPVLPEQIPAEAVVPDAVLQSAAASSVIQTDGPVSEQHSWQLSYDILLQSNEASLFRSFVEHAASWLDLCDPQKYFSTYATRLALRNVGLMKAILALTSRHALGKSRDLNTDVSVPIQYYYETLHYVQESLHYATYTRSEELLATSIIISTYEMLDDANSNWQRHLKGVFWIQRSQDVNGASGGLRQAVWWAWLRQDVWAAFREKRACFSFWRPVKAVSELTQDELANRAIYLLSQAVNFFALSESASMMTSQKALAGETILEALEQWRACLGPAFRPLPTTEPWRFDFKPIWIHPPHYAVAMQAYHFATILVTLQLPTAGFQSYLQTQRVLSEAVGAICGIAMELKDEGCQILCAQCLFGAGLCTQDAKSRETIVALIKDCETRTGWPMSTLITNLSVEWAKLT